MLLRLPVWVAFTRTPRWLICSETSTPGGIFESILYGVVNSLAGSIVFNQRYSEELPRNPCGNGTMLEGIDVAYFSWNRTWPVTNVFNPVEAALSIIMLLFGEPNDGLVSAGSSHLGYAIKDNYKMNHLDEVNQILGIHHLFETDPITLYRRQVNRLKNMEL